MSVLGIGELSISDIFNVESKAKAGELGAIIKELATKYSYVIIDTPAGVGTMVSAFMQISDELIIVINCKTFSLKSLPLLLNTVKDIKNEYNKNLELNGVIINMFKSGNELEKDILEKMKDVFPREVFYNTIIPYSDYFEKASMYALPVAMVTRGHNTAKPFVELAIELKDREANNHIGEDDEESIMGLF
jgi:chromosome partitioning protein